MSDAINFEIGYRGPTACTAAGITYRQLDYWARTGLVEPSVRSAAGSGSARLYGFRDILVLKIVKRLLDTGVSLQNIRSAVEHLRNRGAQDLAGITLMSDGASVYECTTEDEVIEHCDAVYICSWTSEHPRLLAKATAAGRHVVCEKPLEVTLERIDEMISDKRELASQVLDGEGAVKLTEMKDDDLLKFVSLDLERAAVV